MDIPLTGEDQGFLEERVSSGEYPNIAEVLHDVRVHDAGPRRRYDSWREDARRKIDEGFEECLRGELIDGEQVFEELRQEREARRASGS